MYHNILFVCIGNICRSPMAEGMLEDAAHKLNLEKLYVQSAGLHALTGQPADKTAQVLMAAKGIDISAHRAQQLDQSLVRWADLILTMEHNQKETIETMNPAARGKTFRLGEWEGFDVPDPYGRPAQAFEQAAGLIDVGIHQWLPRLEPESRDAKKI